MNGPINPSLESRPECNPHRVRSRGRQAFDYKDLRRKCSLWGGGGVNRRGLNNDQSPLYTTHVSSLTEIIAEILEYGQL